MPGDQRVTPSRASSQKVQKELQQVHCAPCAVYTPDLSGQTVRSPRRPCAKRRGGCRAPPHKFRLQVTQGAVKTRIHGLFKRSVHRRCWQAVPASQACPFTSRLGSARVVGGRCNSAVPAAAESIAFEAATGQGHSGSGRAVAAAAAAGPPRGGIRRASRPPGVHTASQAKC